MVSAERENLQQKEEIGYGGIVFRKMGSIKGKLGRTEIIVVRGWGWFN